MDIFNNKILCNKCNVETNKSYTIKNGFKLRSVTCPNCNQTWFHPQDLNGYNNFKKLKQKPFKVKLRVVGNSWTVSIPKEIIHFHNIEKTQIINLSLEEPDKLSIFFSKLREELLD